MPASIGSFTFVKLDGGVDPAGEMLATITRPNVDGVAYRTAGKRGKPFKMTSRVDLLNAASVATELDGYKAIQGTLITLVEDNGSTWTNVCVLDVKHQATIPVLLPLGGQAGASGQYLVVAEWTLQMTEF